MLWRRKQICHLCLAGPWQGHSVVKSGSKRPTDIACFSGYVHSEHGGVHEMRDQGRGIVDLGTAFLSAHSVQ